MYREMIFAQRLAVLRHEKKLSLRQLGDAIGQNDQTVALWEKGTANPDLESLCRLADYFDVSIDYLAGRTGTQDPSWNRKMQAPFSWSSNDQQEKNLIVLWSKATEEERTAVFRLLGGYGSKAADAEEYLEEEG